MAIFVAALAVLVWSGLAWFRAPGVHGALFPAGTGPAGVQAGATVPAAASSAGPALRFEPFFVTEVDGFLTKARQAEKLKDPLQRCLAYPDPPRSHWNAEAVEAYCRYRHQPTISFAQMRDLIEHGRSAELDRRLAEALQAQLTRPESQGLLDRIYLGAFNKGSFDIRPTLDAWKRASPDSAFAYAASGVAYAAMASEARGADYMRNTPQEKILAMDRLAEEADADLRRALQLDPRLTPAYASMMDIGRMSLLGRTYALQAQAAGLKATPPDYSIYGAASALAEPKWGGSLVEQRALEAQLLQHAKQNPLLYVAATDTRLSEFDFESCKCATPPELARMMDTLQELASHPMLASAGDSAEAAEQRGLAAVYYSEAIRFAPTAETRLSRAFDLVALGYPTWAHEELTAIAPALPGRGDVYRGLGYADLQLEENARARSELEQAVRLDYTDTWSWDSLGWMYANGKQWDKAWDAAGQMTRLQPDDPEGWRLRAYVQSEQPRAGLADTVQVFTRRFGHRPDQQDALRQMREALAKVGH
jgi:tetratricopeptide (TPR) repeat protein